MAVKDLLSVLKSLRKPLEEEDQSDVSQTSEMNGEYLKSLLRSCFRAHAGPFKNEGDGVC